VINNDIHAIPIIQIDEKIDGNVEADKINNYMLQLNPNMLETLQGRVRLVNTFGNAKIFLKDCPTQQIFDCYVTMDDINNIDNANKNDVMFLDSTKSNTTETEINFTIQSFPNTYIFHKRANALTDDDKKMEEQSKKSTFYTSKHNV